MDEIVVSVYIQASGFLVTARSSGLLNAVRAAVMVSKCLAKPPAPPPIPAAPTPASQSA